MTGPERTAWHHSASCHFVNGNGVRFAYRNFGGATDTPLILFEDCSCLDEPL